MEVVGGAVGMLAVLAARLGLMIPAADPDDRFREVRCRALYGRDSACSREKVDVDAFGDIVWFVGDDPSAAGLDGPGSPLRLREDVEAPSRGCASVSEARGDLAARPRVSEEKRLVGLGSDMMLQRGGPLDCTP